MAKKERDDFIVLAPIGKSKDYKIAAKRIGSDEQYTVVATCQSDSMCQRFIAGLALLQGELRKLEVPAQVTLVEVRRALDSERVAARDLREKLRESENKLRQVSRDLATTTDQKIKLEAHNNQLDAMNKNQADTIGKQMAELEALKATTQKA